MSSSNSAPSSESFVLPGDATEQGLDIPVTATLVSVVFILFEIEETRRKD